MEPATLSFDQLTGRPAAAPGTLPETGNLAPGTLSCRALLSQLVVMASGSMGERGARELDAELRSRPKPCRPRALARSQYW